MPLRNSVSLNTILRATASNSPKPRSAAASVTIPGILVTGMPRRVASARAMRSCVMFIDDTALRFGFAASTSASTVSCSSEMRTSQRLTASISAALSSTRLESGLTSTSAMARKRAKAVSAIGWVTKTRGRATIISAHSRDSGNPILGPRWSLSPTEIGDERRGDQRILLASFPDRGIDLRHHFFRQQRHRAFAEFRIAPVLAGIKQCTKVADLFAKFQQLVGDLVRRAMDDELVANAVERDFAIRLVAPGLEQFEPAAAFQLGVKLTVVIAVWAVGVGCVGLRGLVVVGDKNAFGDAPVCRIGFAA